MMMINLQETVHGVHSVDMSSSFITVKESVNSRGRGK